MSEDKDTKSGADPSRKPNSNPNRRRRRGRRGRGRGKGGGTREDKPQRKGRDTPRRQTQKVDKRQSSAPDADAIARAKARYSTKPLPMGLLDDLDPAPQELSIAWKSSPVPLAHEREAGDIVVKPGEFGFLPDERVDEIAEQIEHLDISLEQALSLRAALNQEKAVFSHGRLQRRAQEMLRRYNNGETVLSMSKRFDFPPVNLFRAILSARNWSKNRIKETLRDADKRLDERDLKEFRAAEEADRVTHVNQSETHAAADIFEEVLWDHFRKQGIRFRTQSDLLKEQVAAEGRPVRTPDLLILDQVEINGIPVAWIDAKHFYGANLSFQRKKTQKQVNRYVEEWGHGAIIFRHGFCDGLKLKGALLLDATDIDMTKLVEHNQRLNDEREESER